MRIFFALVTFAATTTYAETTHFFAPFFGKMVLATTATNFNADSESIQNAHRLCGLLKYERATRLSRRTIMSDTPDIGELTMVLAGDLFPITRREASTIHTRRKSLGVVANRYFGSTTKTYTETNKPFKIIESVVCTRP